MLCPGQASVSAVSLGPGVLSRLQWTWKLEAEMGVPGSTCGNPHVLLCGPEWIFHNKYIMSGLSYDAGLYN